LAEFLGDGQGLLKEIMCTEGVEACKKASSSKKEKVS
jgi:hypothetical protein